MQIWEVFLIGIGLSMDAMAVSVSNCLAYGQQNRRRLAAMPLYFGGFQALMPILGACVGGLFADIIQTYSGWAVFVILGAIGASMVWEAMHGQEEKQDSKPLTHWMLLCQAVATSIDAFAVGVGLSAAGVHIVPAACIIGVTTALCTIFGMVLGRRCGELLESHAQVLGGIILIFIGVKSLLGM